MTNAKLQKLQLAGNDINDAGATALANVLINNTKLKNLGLSLNRIGDKGAIALVEALKANKGLQVLNLSQNESKFRGRKILRAYTANNSSKSAKPVFIWQ